MLWQKRDAGLLGYFANRILDSAERQRAWERYHVIRGFVESKECRHRKICTHFGETPKWTTCGACDVCGKVPVWMAQTFFAEPRKRRRKAATGEGRPAGAASHGKVDSESAPAAGLSGEEAELREYLREWRRNEAKESGLATFFILHDATLEEICRRKPKFFAELLQITGIGERKAETLGQPILDALARFRAGARAAAQPQPMTAPATETMQFLREGKSLAEIATIRGRQISTVINTVAQMVEAGEVQFRAEWIDRNKLAVIEAACAKLGTENLHRLKPLKELLPPEITYDEIRLVVARLRRAGNQTKAETPT
jgi:ATP-dependent DNA helicase RecQ